METAEKLMQVPGSILVCVDEHKGKEILGRIYYPGGEGPLQFNEMGRLLIEIDQILDEMNYPESSTSGRSFQKSSKVHKNPKERAAMQEKKPALKKGDKGTFVVQIQYRQHATWQGKVLWAEKNETKQFRSALELLKLIDSALDEDLAPDGLTPYNVHKFRVRKNDKMTLKEGTRDGKSKLYYRANHC